MPLASRAEARDEMLKQFTDQWNTLGTPPLVIYDDKTQDKPDNAPYARVRVQHNDTPQVTVGGKVSQGGSGQRFREFGILTVQIFTISGDGLTNADTLVDLAVDAFQGENTGSDRIEFRNVRANEIGDDGPWYQTNVLAEFNYDRVK